MTNRGAHRFGIHGISCESNEKKDPSFVAHRHLFLCLCKEFSFLQSLFLVCILRMMEISSKRLSGNSIIKPSCAVMQLGRVCVASLSFF